ncbi:MAG: hypothetical protein ACRBHB_26120 [Arenicella sp.]
MKELFKKGKDVLNSATDKLSVEMESGMSIVKDVINGLPIFVSFERSTKYQAEFDEKHYFVIPFEGSETGFSLHTMRYLPVSVPEVNDLPKRRVFHFPNLYYEAALRENMLQSARSLATEKLERSTLESLADDIDALDNKLTYGMLLVGGIAAIFNPIVGAGIAAKAVLPSITGLFTKYGLRPVAEKLTQSQAKALVSEAENKVRKAFSESDTIKVVNPILQELEIALRTNEDEHDPLVDPNMADGSIPELEGKRWRELTVRALYHVYHDTYKDKARHKSASLGPEDIRWLKTLFDGLEKY